MAYSVLKKGERKGWVARWMDLRWIKFDRLLQCYPMFFFLGLRIRISSDYRHLKIRVPLRFYIRNNSGVMFGAAMATASDPFPALLLQKIFPGTVAFTRAHSVKYLRPAKSAVTMVVHLSEANIQSVETELQVMGKAERTYTYYFVNQQNKRVAEVTSTAYLRMLQKRA